MDKSVSRRQFLGTSSKAAAGVAAGLTLSSMVRDADAVEANEKITLGLIGCGNMGRGDLGFMMDTKQCEVAAICDVDDSKAKNVLGDVQEKLGTTPKVFRDFRHVLDMKEIDAVIVATPDHWHAAPMMLACAAGKDIYCEKPCCHNIREGQLMVQAAQKYDRVVQVGTYQRSMPHMQEAYDYIRSGKLGTISMTQTFNSGNETPRGLGDKPDTRPPKYVDYDRWLGPAPERPFNWRRFHFSWRWYFDYAAGMVGDWNVHLQDVIMWTLDASHPIAVSAAGGKYVLTDDRDTPDTMEVIYEFGPSRQAPKGFIHTYTMRKASGKPWRLNGYGMEFHGTNGKMHLKRDRWSVEADEVNWRDNKKDDLRTANFARQGANAYEPHIANFLECLRSRKKPVATIESHYNTAVACHLANISLRVGRKLFWDPKKERCCQDRGLAVPDDGANALLTRSYRKGYELPEV